MYVQQSSLNYFQMKALHKYVLLLLFICIGMFGHIRMPDTSIIHKLPFNTLCMVSVLYYTVIKRSSYMKGKYYKHASWTDTKSIQQILINTVNDISNSLIYSMVVI